MSGGGGERVVVARLLNFRRMRLLRTIRRRCGGRLLNGDVTRFAPHSSTRAAASCDVGPGADYYVPPRGLFARPPVPLGSILSAWYIGRKEFMNLLEAGFSLCRSRECIL